MSAYNAKYSIKDDGLPTLKDQIEHPKFGKGEVTAVVGYEKQLKCTVKFDDSGEERKFLWFVASSVGAKIVKKHNVLVEEANDVEETVDVDDVNEDEIDDVEVDESALDEDEEE